MKIQIKELGAVKDAKIDLDKPLILFCGQNNTGKTYLAFVIYALTRIKIGKSPLKLNIPQLVENGFWEFEIDIEEIFEFKKKTMIEVKSNFDTVFGISEELVEQIFSQTELFFDSDIEDCRKKIFEIELNENISVNNQKIKIIKKDGELKIRLETIEGEDYSSVLKEEIFEIFFSSIVIYRLAFFPISNAVIFPVERNSIFTFSRELSLNKTLLYEQMEKMSKGEKFNPFAFIQNGSNRYPLAIRDGLRVSEDLENIQKSKSDFFEIAKEIEDKLLNGTLLVTKEGDLQFVSNKNKGKKLPIHMSASIVKTMSSLVFYLKYIAQKSDLIIIDEPEMNLHPDSQVILTKIFAKLLSQGFRLLISTHSDYIIREFNNLIMTSNRGEMVKNVAEKYLYDLNDSINPNDVACYFFHFPKPNSKQVSVKNIEIDSFGFEIESIDNEINAQNERVMELNYAINSQE